MSSGIVEDKETITECVEPGNIASARLISTAMDSDAAKDRLRTLARTLGLQAARRHLHRGYSLLEIALCLTLGALVIAALWYGGFLNLHSGHR